MIQVKAHSGQCSRNTRTKGTTWVTSPSADKRNKQQEVGDTGFMDTYHGAMQSAIHRQQYAAILYDADSFPRPNPEWFAGEYWPEREATPQGRGASWFIETEWGPAVLKRYRRGGWAARISRDRYIFRDWEATRSWHEWRVLAHLYRQGLPVPKPWMAWAARRGWWYRCGLMTGRINDALPLPQLSFERLHDPRLWYRVGVLIQRLCAAGVAHADLNLSNILCDGAGRLYGIDFDGARMTPGEVAPGEAQIRRLLRSYARWQQSLANMPSDEDRFDGLHQEIVACEVRKGFQSNAT